MRLSTLILMAALLLAGCATTAPTPASRAEPPAPAAGPSLRLLQLLPPEGARVDSATVITAVLAYHIPGFDPAKEYRISAMFAGRAGGTFSRGGGDVPIQQPVGMVTVQHSLAGLDETGGVDQATSPLTGTFFLLERGSAVVAEDTVYVSERMRIRRSSRATVLAGTRTFFYNGGGPARSLSRSLVDVLEEYWSYRLHRALAVAHDEDGRWTFGYAYGQRSPESAVQAAMEACRTWAERRGIEAECRVVAVDDRAEDGQPLPAP